MDLKVFVDHNHDHLINISQYCFFIIWVEGVKRKEKEKEKGTDGV